jgi:hypothetical protein
MTHDRDGGVVEANFDVGEERVHPARVEPDDIRVWIGSWLDVFSVSLDDFDG